MPGVIMENGNGNGQHTNHDRDQRPNGVNGASHTGEKSMEKGKGRAEPQQNVTPVSPTAPHGMNGSFMSQSKQVDGKQDLIPSDIQARMNELPPQINHIVEGHLLSLNKLLSRVAQKTHNDLERTIIDLARIPIPVSVANGSGSHSVSSEDNSKENVDKKARLLKFAQEAHTELTKALVITNWSRRSGDVAKLIDLKAHLDKEKFYYEMAIHELFELKRTLGQARIPNPDLKTALEVLTTGKVTWMPDLGYIQPQPLTPQEILKSLENLNTILSIRLNLDEYHKIPYHFKNYSIQNGRVTFKVEGEFEVDLTVADENSESQFWFIDFRFLFQPSLSDLAPKHRFDIEQKVNETLKEDGLAGCYKFLHGLVLNHQISEFGRQAIALSSGTWVETLKVEPLNRALSIQYWVNRYGQKGPKSWVILGVHSGKRKTGVPHPRDTPRLFLRWFREGKEVKDANIPFQTATISAESLLKTVIALHVRHILETTYHELLKKPIYANGGARLALCLHNQQPSESKLTVQLTSERQVFIKIEHITGRCIVGPTTRLTGMYEFKFNLETPEPGNFLHARIDELRYEAVGEYITARGSTAGWHRVSNPGLGRDDLKALVPEGTAQVLWFKRRGWVKNWYLAVSMGSSGERWWLVETTDPAPEIITHGPRKVEKKMVVKIISFIAVPIKNQSPLPNYSFLTNLHVFTAALMSHHANLKALYVKRVQHVLQESGNLRSPMQLPAIYARISNLVEWKNKTTKDLVKLSFQGLESCQSTKLDGTPRNPDEAIVQLSSPESDEIMITEARINIPVPETLKNMKENIDRDIAFDSNTGMLALRLRSKIGDSIIPALVERTIRVFRLVEFVKVLQEHEASLRCEQISLGKITFTYSMPGTQGGFDKMDVDMPSKRYTAVVDFSATENNMSFILEKGNPHLMVLDHMRSILNGKEGLGGVATLLPITLPVVTGLDSIEMTWGKVSKAKGEVFVLIRATDWYEFRYDIAPISTDSSNAAGPRTVTFEIKLRNRAGEPWWDIRRTDHPDPPGDDIEAVLKPVWNSSGTGFLGMRVSSVAQPHGVEELLSKIDEVVRNLVVAQKTAVLSPTAMQKSRSQGQQARQQPTPNQSQSSQGRNNQARREVVEID